MNYITKIKMNMKSDKKINYQKKKEIKYIMIAMNMITQKENMTGKMMMNIRDRK